MTDQVNEAVQYRKKPVVVEAVQWDGSRLSHVPEWLGKAITTPPGEVGGVFRVGDQIHVFTLEGTMIATPGDWIIRGVKGEFYPCKPDIFAATYEPAAHPSRGVVDEAMVERAAIAIHECKRKGNLLLSRWERYFPDYQGKIREQARAALQAAALPAVPEGMVLVPERMHLSVEALEALSFHCSGVDPESTDLEERWCSGTLWVGDILDDDGKPTHGLHLSNDECPEEGSMTLVEFAAALPAVPEDWREDVSLAAQMLTWGRDEGLDEKQIKEIDAHAERLFAMLAATEAATPAHDQPEGDES